MQEHNIYLGSSNSLNDLASYLSLQIKKSKLGVFRPIYIVTQTEGMNSWLKLKLAEHLGIAANIVFLKPNELVNRMYYWTGGRFSKALSANNIVWLVFKILGEKEFIEKFPSVSSYYTIGGQEKDVKRMSLAEKIADLFDQYQVYRPDMIALWNSGKRSTKHPEEVWQQFIWDAAKKQAGGLLPDKTVIKKHIETVLENPDAAERLRERIPCVYLFGISLITEYHLSILQLVSKTIPVHFLILNPAPSLYWYEEKSEKAVAFLRRKGLLAENEDFSANPLLTNWGKIIQDTFLLLFKSEEIINSYEVISEHPFKSDTLLHKIQQTLAENIEETVGVITTADLMDGTINISSCFNAFREVEALYNYLVHLIDQKKENLSPRDIIVMVSDIEMYGSYIRAVFDYAPYKFRYTIADEVYTNSDSVFNAMVSIAELTTHNFTSERVFRLLDFSCIRQKTGIENVDLIRRVIDEANIRFGIEGNFDDDSQYVSWRYGLQRIMYGICISGGEEYGSGESSFFPIDSVESSDAWDIIRFVHFVETLIHFVQSRKTNRTVVEWAAYFEDVFNSMLFVPEFSGEEENLLLGQIQSLNATDEFFGEKIQYDVFLIQFLPTLQSLSRSSAFAGGGITFCSLIPMRSIPFKVVALLGLNFDKLPRKNRPVSFSLMEKEKRRGDRNVKENDKHLFLETLLSAGDYLYLSYIGQSTKDNSELPTSVLVDELLDFIEKNAEESSEVRKHLITRHPLHNFSNRYGTETGLHNYLHQADNKTIEAAGETKQFELLEEININNFIAFFKNPIKYFYNNVLEIYYTEEEVSLGETELFALDGLGMHQLKKWSIELSDEEIEEFKTAGVKKGKLPLKNMADVVVDNALEEMEEVKHLWEELTNGKTRTEQEFNLRVGNFLLQGIIDDIYDDNVVVISLSKNENKYLVEAYLKSLIIAACGWDPTLIFISANKQQYFEAQAPNKKEALARLNDLLTLFQVGHQAILPFSADISTEPNKWRKYLPKDLKKQLTKQLDKSYACPYLRRAFQAGLFNEEDTFDRYLKVADKVLHVLPQIFNGY